MNLGQIARSPAGMKIWAAGEAFAKKHEKAVQAALAEVNRVWEDEQSQAPKLPTLTQIVSEVCEKHQILPTDLRSKRRVMQIVGARLEYYYRSCQETDASYSRIGKFIKKDHTSVISGARRYASLLGLPRPRAL